MITVLITNDDGIDSDTLWLLASGLRGLARVIVAAPDRERSAIGTAVTLRRTLKVKQVQNKVPGIEYVTFYYKFWCFKLIILLEPNFRLRCFSE